jgi:hypothetical protein
VKAGGFGAESGKLARINPDASHQCQQCNINTSSEVMAGT